MYVCVCDYKNNFVFSYLYSFSERLVDLNARLPFLHIINTVLFGNEKGK